MSIKEKPWDEASFSALGHANPAKTDKHDQGVRVAHIKPTRDDEDLDDDRDEAYDHRLKPLDEIFGD